MNAEIRILENTDWITLVILFSLILIVIAKQLFQNRFMSFIILPFNNKYVTLYSKKDKMRHGFHVLLTCFQLLNTALYIYLSYNALYDNSDMEGMLIFGLVLGVVMLFVIVKMILQLTNAFVFNNMKIITDLIYKKHTYLNYSGLVMLIANVIMTYIVNDSETVVFLSLFLILMINCIGLITILKDHQKLISNYFFYFILYLCALEIAPLIFIANFLKY